MTTEDKDRTQRLATALRENLRKRKAQSRSLSEKACGKSDREGDRDDQA